MGTPRSAGRRRATWSDAELAELEASILGRPEEEPLEASLAEAMRAQAARIAQDFGFSTPVFRTSLQVRFTGEAVQGHSLPGAAATAVLGSLIEVVEAAAADAHLPTGAAELFLSPVVMPGSAILELFGRESADPARLDTDVDDSPVDGVLSSIFDLLEGVGPETEQIDATKPLGYRLIQLAENLKSNSVDIDLKWTSRSGRQRRNALHRGRAGVIRALLDVETVESSIVEGREGVAESITASDQRLVVKLSHGRLKSVELDASGFSKEELRGMWGERVLVSWREVVRHQPSKTKTDVERSLVRIEVVGGAVSPSAINPEGN